MFQIDGVFEKMQQQSRWSAHDDMDLLSLQTTLLVVEILRARQTHHVREGTRELFKFLKLKGWRNQESNP